ncbi:MAG: transpeptidase family protein [Ignavibacteriaceae bacterium]|nr:transpeptidase family protein [Ignavibacteriaceae bacterium]
MNNSRVLLILIIVVLIFSALVFRLVNLQVVRSDELSYFAKRQQTNTQTVKADRGFIYDRNDVLLVYNRNDYSFYVDLRMLPALEKDKLAKMFSKVIGKSKLHYSKLLKASGKTICLEKKVPFEKSLDLFEYKNPAFFYVEEPISVFHYGSLASHILGYVDNDYKGVNGISKSFDDVLRGKDGFRMVERNAMGDIISISEKQTRASIPGDDIYLTIDKRYQTIVEEELKQSLKANSGESATCIIMNPNTGEILSMANISDYDPNQFWKYGDFERKNRAITDSYEPGSTFKAITFAALLEDKACDESERINVENGVYKFRNNYIRDSHKFESLTVREILEESSNIGTAKLIQRMSDEKFYQYVRSFGFGTFTSISLPGEVTGKLVDLDKWNNQTKTYMSFGYSISVTPLQITNAFCAIVNGGILYQPQIVKRQVDKNGITVREYSPELVRRVISERTSERMRSLLLGAVQKGTGQQAKIDSLAIGGKTGTSKIIVNGKYSDSQYYSSFIGFYPANNPTIVCYVLINKPTGHYYGGLVSAPVFKNILTRIYELEKGKYNHPKPSTDIKIADNKNQGSEYEFVSHESKLDDELNESQNVFASDNAKNLMPDLRGKTIKEALLILNDLGVKWNISGSGVVAEQSIPPGQMINKRKTCILTCLQLSTSSARIY